MSDKDDKKQDDQNPGGAGSDSDGQEGDLPGGDPKKLEDLDTQALIDMVGEIRGEAAKYRKRAKKAEGQVGDLNKKLKDVNERIEALEEEQKTDAEKEAERIAELEAQAASAGKLGPYREYVEAQYTEAVSVLDDLEDDDPRKTTYAEALNGFAEDDVLGRLRILRALKAAEGTGERVRDGDEGNPGETGDGASEKKVSPALFIGEDIAKLAD